MKKSCPGECQSLSGLLLLHEKNLVMLKKDGERKRNACLPLLASMPFFFFFVDIMRWVLSL
jgi:hypothetical protein